VAAVHYAPLQRCLSSRGNVGLAFSAKEGSHFSHSAVDITVTKEQRQTNNLRRARLLHDLQQKVF
jgi:hypothetical protein